MLRSLLPLHFLMTVTATGCGIADASILRTMVMGKDLRSLERKR